MTRGVAVYQARRALRKKRSVTFASRVLLSRNDSLAGGIDHPIEVIPLLLGLNIYLIDAVRVVRCGEMRAALLVELRSMTLYLPKHGDVIDGGPLAPASVL